MKCGTPEEDQDALVLTRKDAAPDMGWDEGDLGTVGEGSDATLQRGENTTGTYPRRGQ